MYKTKLMVLGGLMSCIAALFQILPVFLSEAFIILTIFSSMPIYVICRIHPKIGITAAMVSFILISFLSTHEALLFIFTNAPIGISLGSLSHFNSKQLIVVSLTSIILSCSLCILNFIIGIPIFGAQIPGILLIQILIISIFSLIYSFIYFYFSQIIYSKLFIFTNKFK